ncbi:MAG: hypothetical protein ACEPOW_05500 [Bacteroidales bacterium]
MKKIIFLLVLIALKTSCSIAPKKYHRENQVLSTYLKEMKLENIPSKFEYLILIPSFHCEGCVLKSFQYLAQMIDENTKSKICIIGASNVVFPNYIKQRIKVYKDKRNILDSYQLDLESFSIFKMKEENIVDIKFFNSENLLELEEFDFTI